jgi:hypothetical protein
MSGSESFPILQKLEFDVPGILKATASLLALPARREAFVQEF